MLDIYLYPDSDVMVNKYDEHNIEKLKEIEAFCTSSRLAELCDNPINGCYDINHYMEFHKYIFQDLYEWAGSFRKINIEKSEPVLKGASVEYSDIFDIIKDLETVLIHLNAVQWNKSKESNISLFIHFISDVWKIHPFREGNTRTTMFFFYQLMDEKNVFLDKKLLSDNAEYVRTALVVSAFRVEGIYERNYSYLEKIVRDAMTKK